MKVFRMMPVWLIASALVAGGGLMLLNSVRAYAALNDAAPVAAPAMMPTLAQGNAGGEAAGNANQGGDQKQQEKMSFLELLAKGRWFMVPIGACSLLGLALIFERLMALRKSQIIPPQFMPGLRNVFKDAEEDRDDALNYCHTNESPISRVMAVGIRKIPQGEEAVEQAIEDAGANEVSKLKRNLRLLYGVSAIAPMLGLLGTVWGMIEAFEAASRMGLGKADHLATGIYEALVTTFAGLSVAIPVLIFYYYFLSKIEMIVSDLNDKSEDFIESYIVGLGR